MSKQCSLLVSLSRLYTKLTSLASYLGMPVLMLIYRLWIGNIFWKSGLVKISNWEATLFLFKNMYKVPLLPVGFSAASATAIELIAPIMLLVGFGTRFAAAAMLIMTAVIEFSVMKSNDPIYWSLILTALLFYGAGTLSLDYIVKKKIMGRCDLVS